MFMNEIIAIEGLAAWELEDAHSEELTESAGGGDNEGRDRGSEAATVSINTYDLKVAKSFSDLAVCGTDSSSGGSKRNEGQGEGENPNKNTNKTDSGSGSDSARKTVTGRESERKSGSGSESNGEGGGAVSTANNDTVNEHSEGSINNNQTSLLPTTHSSYSLFSRFHVPRIARRSSPDAYDPCRRRVHNTEELSEHRIAVTDFIILVITTTNIHISSIITSISTVIISH